MTVLEIKKALECCYAYDRNDRDIENCRECPYLTCVEEPCFNKLAKDALKTIDELEKRNEPIKPNTILTTGAGIGLSHCPTCGESIDEYHHPSFCGNCGQAVKWNA